MKIPTLHLNGSSKESLREQLMDAYTGVRKAIDAVCAAAPHGRDYYVQGPDAYPQARRDHESRLARLKSVQDEILAIWEGIDKS